MDNIKDSQVAILLKFLKSNNLTILNGTLGIDSKG